QLGQDREMELRRETIAHLSPTASTPALPINTNVVYFGPYTPRFNILRSQLSDQGITLKAALTANSLRDICATSNAAAVLFDISDEDASVADALKSFTQYPTKANVSKIILTAPDQVMPNIGLADHIIDADDTHRTAEVIHQVAACQSTAMPSDPSITDNATGLFTRTFLEAHLSAQLKTVDQTGQPLTLIGIELSDHLRGKKSTGDILRKHLRMTDLAARYSARHIVISLPATAYGGAVQMARRLQAECEMISAVSVLERRQFHTAQSLLSGLLAHSDFAASKRA
ncbi:MAG: diguanylate cyclase, partial [Pseudomonadota bacterium]